MPTLVLAGGSSLTAPPSVARDLARRIPGAKLRIFGGYWADPFFADPTGCIPGLVHAFLDREPIGREGCNSSYLSVKALPEAPSSLDRVAAVGAAGNPGRTLAAARLTARDGIWALSRQVVPSEPPAVWTLGALREGSYAYLTEDLERGSVTFSLHAASYVPGVTVSGQITLGRYQKDSSGRLEVGGPAAAPGVLDLRGSTLTGTLGGVPVSTSLSYSFLFDFGVSNGY